MAPPSMPTATLAGRSSRPAPVSAAAGLVDPRGVADAAVARAAGLRVWVVGDGEG